MTKTEDNPMHLKTREPSRLRQAPRCLARTRRGTPCQSPAVAGKTRCRMHGGAAGSGAPKGRRNGKYRQGGFTTEAIDEPWIATRCLPSTTSRLSTGSICERPTPSKAHSRRPATEQCAPKDASRTRPLAMIFKLAEAAEKSWRRLDGHNQLPKIILGVRFTDGIEVVKPQAQAAAA